MGIVAGIGFWRSQKPLPVLAARARAGEAADAQILNTAIIKFFFLKRRATPLSFPLLF